MENLREKLPESPGVYIFKDKSGKPLYVGKAGNLRRRVASYFARAHDSRIEALVVKANKIDYRKTDTALEALILEAELIKRYSPPFNVKEKDDKSFLYVEITNDEFPRVLLSRGRDVAKKAVSRGVFGPFTSASNIREALKILRRIFPWSTHEPSTVIDQATLPTKTSPKSKFRRACFDYEIGLCPGTCVGATSRSDYIKNIKNLELFFEGKKGHILRALEREMAGASREEKYETAEKLKRQIFALRHIRDIAFISESELQSPGAPAEHYRIEGYDISNISGTSAVGSMVVFTDGRPDKDEYRKFRIRTVTQSDDTGMLKEVLERRFNNDWPLPDLLLIDGGRGQVNAARSVLNEKGLKIPVVGLAKGPKRKKNELVGVLPKGVNLKTLVKVRNEAHRFAISYHRNLREGKLFG